MNRRSILKFLGLAPAVPMAVAAETPTRGNVWVQHGSYLCANCRQLLWFEPLPYAKPHERMPAHAIGVCSPTHGCGARYKVPLKFEHYERLN
jgi:hypothetical protein